MVNESPFPSSAPLKSIWTLRNLFIKHRLIRIFSHGCFSNFVSDLIGLQININQKLVS